MKPRMLAVVASSENTQQRKRQTLGPYRDCPREMTDSRMIFSRQFRSDRLKWAAAVCGGRGDL